MRKFFLLMLIGLMLTVQPIDIMGKSAKQDQKKGLLEGHVNKQIKFVEYVHIDLDYSKVPLKKVRKIDMHDNKLFILDGRRSELYVIDKNGKFLYTIGRPGQGPFEFEYCKDFYIANGKIYVLNAMSKRVEIFTIAGRPVNSIRLEENGGLIKAEGIAVNNTGEIFVSGAFKQILGAYSSSKGVFKRLLFQRQDMIAYKGTSSALGIPSRLDIIDGRLYHFDLFTGIFTKTGFSGEIETVFNGYAQHADEDVRKIKKENKGGESFKGKRNLFTKWANFCYDDSGTIYALLLSTKKPNPQEVFVFSKQGDLLYRMPLDYFKALKIPIRFIACDNASFAFYTFDKSIIIANRRKK
jgi:hypothetical protein